jgi:4-carboxymuconolactone decarboxylase
MPRLSQLTPDTLDDSMRKAYDAILADPASEETSPEHEAVYGQATRKNRAAIAGPMNIWLRSPGLAGAASNIANFLRYKGSLSPRHTELVILIVARHWGAPYAWATHAKYGAATGVSSAVIEAIADQAEPTEMESLEILDVQIWRFATELLSTKRVTNETYNSVADQLGETKTVELVSLIGYYSMITMTLNAFEVEAPEGNPAPF